MRSALLLGLVLLGSSCVVGDVALDGLPCPCAGADWRCDETTNTCVHLVSGPYSLSVSPTAVAISQGHSSAVQVTLTTDVAQTITVRLTQLPAGIAAAPGTITLTPKAPSGELVLTAGTDVLIGPAQATIEGTGPRGDVVAVPLALDVGGRAGSVDTSFGMAGSTTYPITQVNLVQGLAIRPDDKILVGGGSGGQCFLEQLDADGAPDPSFGNAGFAAFSTSGSCTLYHLELDTAGRALLFATLVGPPYSAAVLRVRPDGTLDPSFGSGGIVNVALGQGDSYAMRGAVLPDGKILIAGTADNTAGSRHIALSRLLDNGSVDLSFGTQGQVVTSFTPNPDFVGDLLARDDGSFYVSGTTWTVIPPFGILARFQKDGALDPRFGSGGVVLGASPSRFGPMLPGPGNGVLVGGDHWDGSVFGKSNGSFLWRYTDPGSLDLGFGQGGMVEIGNPPPIGPVTGLVALPNGSVAVAGQAALVEIAPDGMVDPAFGYVLIAPDPAMGLGRLSNGKLVVLSQVTSNGFRLTRYWP